MDDGSNNAVFKGASDISNISFDHEDNVPIKKEIKQEIKNEPLDEDKMQMDAETLSYENDPMIINGENDPEIIANERQSNKNFSCDKCGKSFVSQSYLKIHNWLHQ